MLLESTGKFANSGHNVEENSVKETVDSTMKHVSKKMSEREYQAQDSILAVILTSSKKEA